MTARERIGYLLDEGSLLKLICLLNIGVKLEWMVCQLQERELDRLYKLMEDLFLFTLRILQLWKSGEMHAKKITNIMDPPVLVLL